MKATTYTILVTIHHDDRATPDTKQLADQIQQGLEEGTREHKGVSAACVDAFEGDVTRDVVSTANPLKKVQALHRDLRANPGTLCKTTTLSA